MTASGQKYLNHDHGRNDQTRKDDNSEECFFGH